MESLLRWGIQNSSATADNAGTSASAGVPERKDLDPAILDHILGRPDAELMKEAIDKAHDTSLPDDARVQALDDLEMLVEHIDNASDLERLELWPPIHGFLVTQDASDELKTQALWVVGTAVQNNPAAQRAYLALDPSPLPTVLSFLHPSVRSPALRSKAVYALSNLLKHNRAAVASLGESDWATLRAALQDSDIGVRRKLAFLLNTLILPGASASPSTSQPNSGPGMHGGAAAPVHANSHAAMLADPNSAVTAGVTLDALRAHGILPALVNELARPTPHGADGESDGDVDLEEKLVRLLHTYAIAHNGEFSEEDKVALRDFFAAHNAEKHGLEEGEMKELLTVLT